MNSQEIRLEITNQIAKAMESGCPPWRAPWNSSRNSGMPRNIITNKRYSGVNILLLMMSSSSHGFRSKYWGTRKQWESIGGIVESPVEFDPSWETSIIYSRTFEKDRKGPIEGIKDRAFFIKYYSVFNVGQIKALDTNSIYRSHPNRQRALAKKFLKIKVPFLSYALAEEIHQSIKTKLNSFRAIRVNTQMPDAACEKFIQSTGAKIVHSGDKALYWPAPKDFIQMPDPDVFENQSSYYEVMFHELCHWAENNDRIGQSKKHKDNYAFSELVAQLGACYLSAELGVPLAQQMLSRSQSYIKSWLAHMNNDARFIFEASGHSGKLVDYLLNLQKTSKLVNV